MNAVADEWADEITANRLRAAIDQPNDAATFREGIAAALQEEAA